MSENRIVMRKMIIIALALSLSFKSQSQNLLVEGTAPNLYISHTVAPKENFYSIGRLYNQAPKQIASFNNVAMEAGLKIGQNLKVPLNANNFDATGKAAAGENLVPLAHVVTKSESLFKIGTDFKVSAQSLRQWNNLGSDNLTPGVPLVIGHLKLKGDKANLPKAAAGSEQSPARPVATVTKQAPVVKEEPIVVAPAPPPAEKNDSKTFSSIDVKKPAETQTKTVSTPEKKKEEPVKETTKETAVKEPVKEPAKAKAKEEENEGLVPVRAASKTQERPSTRIEDTKRIDLSNAAEGVFSSIFSTEISRKSLNTKNGDAATFKSTSGWQDKKYYVLMNDIAPGTIVKVSAPNTDKAIYAKVLGGMPEMKENNGLLLRISNAAASYLGIIDPKFSVEVSFYQ
jgi:LysM repeat protein